MIERKSIQTVRGCIHCLMPQEDGFPVRYNQPIAVCITGDEYGMTLSLADNWQTGVQLVIPLEPIQDRLIEVIRKWGK